MDSGLRSLQTELRPQVDRILEHHFLQAVTQAKLTASQLERFAREYQLVSEFFPRNLCAAAATMPTDSTRFFLIKNLWEEHGDGDPQRSHRYLYWRFLNALGVRDPDAPAPRLASTSSYTKKMLRFCQHANATSVIGALCFGVESYTAEQYRRILTGLQAYGRFSEEQLEFFHVHIHHDARHYAELIEVISELQIGPSALPELIEGARKALELELALWDGFARGILPAGDERGRLHRPSKRALRS